MLCPSLTTTSYGNMARVLSIICLSGGDTSDWSNETVFRISNSLPTATNSALSLASSSRHSLMIIWGLAILIGRSPATTNTMRMFRFGHGKLVVAPSMSCHKIHDENRVPSGKLQTDVVRLDAVGMNDESRFMCIRSLEFRTLWAPAPQNEIHYQTDRMDHPRK